MTLRQQVVRNLLIVIFCLVFVCSAIAAPAITSLSGTFNDQNSFTITGTGFGTKSPAAPVIWDRWEDVSLDTTADAGTWGCVGTGSITIESSIVHAGSQSIKIEMGNGGCSFGDLRIDEEVSGSGGTFYVSFWNRWTDVPGSDFDQKKLLRYYRGADCSWTLNWVRSGNGGWPDDSNHANLSTRECGSGYNNDSDPSTNVNINTWYRDEIIAKQGSSGSVFYRHCTAAGSCETVFDSGTTNTGADNLETLYFTNYGVGASGNYVYYDDIYFDTTWSRIVVCNNATYSSVTHCEMFVPTSWSTTEIQGTVQQGTFGASDTAYIFVFDDSNVANPTGYTVQYGQVYGAPEATAMEGTWELKSGEIE